MTASLSDVFRNSSVLEALSAYWGGILGIVAEFYDGFDGIQAVVVELPESLYFDDFQWCLLKTFAFLLLLNLFLIFVAWRVYRKDVCDRFMKPVTSKAIEELKASVSRLKLPKEHTPRI